MRTWTSKDILACIIVPACLAMIAFGIDSWVKYTLLVVVCLYYGVDISSVIKVLREGKLKREGDQ